MYHGKHVIHFTTRNSQEHMTLHYIRTLHYITYFPLHSITLHCNTVPANALQRYILDKYLHTHTHLKTYFLAGFLTSMFEYPCPRILPGGYTYLRSHIDTWYNIAKHGHTHTHTHQTCQRHEIARHDMI